MKKFIDRMLDSFKPIRKNDPVFGSMLYMGKKLRYWEGEATFLPCNSEIEVFVDGDKDGVFSNQHEFFRRVCTEWPELSRVIDPVLQDAYSQMKGTPPVPWEDFVVTSISIPDSSLDVAEWEITFLAKSHESYSYSIQMKGRVPIAAVCDC